MTTDAFVALKEQYSFLCYISFKTRKIWNKNWSFSGGIRGKEPVCQCRRQNKMWVQSLGREDPLEKEMATHSSILAWRIPWTEEPDGLQSMGSQELDTTEATYDTNTHVSFFNKSSSCYLIF